MKVALIGSNGLLGSAIKNELLKLNIECLFLMHNNFQIEKNNSYVILDQFKPNIIINTAAYLGVEPCETNPMKAFEINTVGVASLARYCEDSSIVLVQISTDGVFDGNRGNYTENDKPEPINIYGLSKYNAEQLVGNLCKKYYIARIPILFGNRENIGNIFIEKMYSLYLNEKSDLRISDDIINRPSYSVDVASMIVKLFMDNYEYGIYHIFNGGQLASLYDFAKAFFHEKGIQDIVLSRAKACEFAKNEIGLKPLNTSLASIKIQPLRDWQDGLKEYIRGEQKYVR